MESLLVIGPAGSGKSTFCASMKEFLNQFQRKTCIFNLDPANDALPYTADIDICDLITLDDACVANDLGPNGGLIYCMEFIHTNISWVIAKLLENKENLILIDCPGQIELFTQHPVLNYILQDIQEKCKMKCVAVNLMDSNLCAQPHTFIAACLSSLSIMTHLELPHLNVLSKIDMLSNFYQDLRYSLDFYTDISEISKIISTQDFKFNEKLAKISLKLAEVIEDFSLVGFQLFSVNDSDTVIALLKQIERTLGTHFHYIEGFHDGLVAERIASIEEKYSKKTNDVIY